ELVSDAALHLIKKALRRPVFLGEEVLQAGAVAALTETLLITEDPRNCASNLDDLSARNKGIQPDGKMRVARKTSADANGVANLVAAAHCDEGNIIDLGIGTPYRAPSGRHLELTWQVVELRIRNKGMGQFLSKRRGVGDFVMCDACERAARNISN